MKGEKAVLVLALIFLLTLAACAPVMPSSARLAEGATAQEPEPPAEPMPPMVSAEPGAPTSDGEPALAPEFKPVGKVLVDATTPYIEFNDADFQAAKAAGKIIYLEFSAVWCPFCQRLDPVIKESLRNLNDPAVVGFKVDYDDSKALQKQYNVIYQHTHIILKRDGTLSWKSLDTDWNEELFRSELAKAED